MPEILTYGFMQRAVAASVIIGVLCSIIGVFVILRGLTFMGAGTAHAAFAGVALGFLLDLPPLMMAVLFGLATAWTVGSLYERGGMRLDVSIGIFYTATMALAILFIGLMRTYRPELFGYLFGNILSVTPGDLEVIAGLALVVLLTLFVFYKEFHFLTFDHAMAEAAGIPARPLFFLLLSLITLTIVVALKAVGALLVFALIVIPAAGASLVCRTMAAMIGVAVLLGISSSVGGVFLSYWLDLPSGAMIVLLATMILLVLALAPRAGLRSPARPS